MMFMPDATLEAARTKYLGQHVAWRDDPRDIGVVRSVEWRAGQLFCDVEYPDGVGFMRLSSLVLFDEPAAPREVPK